MTALPLRRRLSTIEVVGQWLALAVALATGRSLLETGLPRLLAVVDEPAAVWSTWLGFWIDEIVVTAPIVAILAIAFAWLPERRLWRWPLLVLAVAAATALAWAAMRGWYAMLDRAPMTWPWLLAALHDWLVTAVAVAVLGEYRHVFVRAAEALHESSLERLRLQGELAASHLRLREAQVEPHFLFNSLANVRRLLERDGPAGRAMLADLLRYLDSALPRLRDDAPTLEREIEVVRAYLNVHQVRMGSRLEVDVDVPAALHDRVVPPMMLITLVENALKHGLQPLPEGGAIRIAAHGDAKTLRLDVADTGRGLGTAAGSGTGLSNIRGRLRAMYGATASLALRVNEPRGVVATIEIPSVAT